MTDFSPNYLTPPIVKEHMNVVEAAKLAIASDPARKIPLRELSRAVNCSPFRLSRAFRRATGQTLASYRHALRVLVALERLRDANTDLTELALELGYSSHSHFTHIFRRHLGITPSQVRASRVNAP